ncbi:MAG: cation transporter, partial [Proteobacteria bacterium]|nr:cation transporter [Pseudomonadota bacterium]
MKHKISIQGMTCGGCAAKISSNLRAQPQVSRAVIDYATASGVVEGEITETLIKEVIEKSGYKVASVSAEIEIAENLSPSIFVDPDVRNLFFAGSIAVVVAALAMGPWAGQFLVLEGVLASIFLGGPGRLFFVRAWRQLLLKSVTMDTLISLGMLSAWGLSWVLLAQGHSHLYFESAVMIVFFVMLGKVLEERARKNSIQEIDR